MLTRRALFGGLAGFGCPAASAQTESAPAGFQHILVGSRRRRFRIVAPQNSAGRPLVLAFHGLGDSPANMARYSRLDETATRQGWTLAYPEAANGRWPYFSAAQMEEEIRYCDALITHLIEERGADPRRVHLTGMSAGAFFINVVAARLSERIASIAVHSGGAGVLARDGIHAVRKYPALIIHGADDRVVPIENGRALAELYRSEGHAVEFREYPNWPHAWAYSLGVNDTIADFFARHPRD